MVKEYKVTIALNLRSDSLAPDDAIEVTRTALQMLQNEGIDFCGEDNEEPLVVEGFVVMGAEEVIDVRPG